MRLVKKSGLLPFVFLVFCGVTAMEQKEEKSLLNMVPLEIKMHIAQCTILVCSFSQSIDCFRHLNQVNKEWNSIINNACFINNFVKKLHMKSKKPKIEIRYVLNTLATRRKLLERMSIITKYAFLHHNSLMHQRGGTKTIRGGDSITTVLLEDAFKAIHESRKNNKDIWNASKDIVDTYSRTTAAHPIDLLLDAYDDNSGHHISAMLLYVAENSDSILKRQKSAQHTLFDFLSSETLYFFFLPTGWKPGHIRTQMMARINPKFCV